MNRAGRITGLVRRWPGLVVALILFPALLAAGLLLLPTRPRASWTEDTNVVAISPDGRRLVTSGAVGTKLRDAATGRVLGALGPSRLVDGVRFSPDGRLLIADVASDRFGPLLVNDLHLWDARTGGVVRSFEYADEPMNPRWSISDDGRWLTFQRGFPRPGK